MANRAHIVTMDEARATAQLSRQQPHPKQRILGAPKKASVKRAARTPGVRKLGQSPRAQEMPPRRDSRPLGPAAPALPAQPAGRRASQAAAAAPAAPRSPRAFAANVPARPAREQREVFRFNEYEERAAERAQAASQDVPEAGASQPQRKPGLVKRLTERFGAKKRAAAKTRASRRFDRRYGGPSAPVPSEGAGPRAAVYQGQMGSSHKRASRSLASGALGAATAVAGAAAGSRKRKESQGRFPMKVLVPAVVAACLAATCVFMYGPVQLWYQEMRENDRLQIEYAALQERNGALQDDVSSLSSEAGIEDRVHQQYGWVRSDEQAVSVSGLSATNDIDFIANVSPGSIKPPDTWYSAFLDPLFGVA